MSGSEAFAASAGKGDPDRVFVGGGIQVGRFAICTLHR